MDKVFIICNKQKEIDRLKNLEEIIKKSNINYNDVEFFCKYWSDDIKVNKNVDGFTEYDGNIFHILNDAEISLFINHIEILKKIKNNYTSGNFLILESDAYVGPNMDFSNDHLIRICNHSSKLKDWDVIIIGGRCYEIFNPQGYPKTSPIIIDKDKYFKEDRIVCAEALIWNYESICKFLNLFEKYNLKNNNVIRDPIDVIFDNLVQSKDINIFWKLPYLCHQGSGVGVNSNGYKFKSWLR